MNRAECGIIAYYSMNINAIIASILCLTTTPLRRRASSRRATAAFLEAKLVAARFYAEVVLTEEQF